MCFISIDDNEVDNLKKLCNETFGEENFVAQIVWQKRYSPANDHKTICPIHDFILVYRKSDAWQRNLLERTEENDKQYRYEDEKGVFRPDNYKCNKTADQRPNLYYQITNPNTGEAIWPSKDAVWRYSPERHAENVKNDMVFWGKDGTAHTPAFKRYRDQLRNGGGTVPGTWWTYEFAGHNDEAAKENFGLMGSKAFSTPKPVRLLTRILQLATCSDGDDIVLDFFSGSATTAHAVMQLNKEDGGNRRFICVQLPELCDENSEAYKAGYKNICEIGKERIRRAGAKLTETSDQLQLGEQKPLDIGFKVFKLDTSNLREWDSTPIPDNDLSLFNQRMNEMVGSIKSDRTDLDVVCEVMLKMGVPLDTPVFHMDVNGKRAYSIGTDCLLLVCLANGITAEDMEALCEYAPAKIIMAEEGFADDTALSNAHYILRDKGIELKLV